MNTVSKLMLLAATAAATPALAVLPAPVISFALQAGNFPGISSSGSTVGLHQINLNPQTAVRTTIGLTPYASIDSSVANNETSSVAQAIVDLSYDYGASFIAASGQTFSLAGAIRTRGYARLGIVNAGQVNLQITVDNDAHYFSCYDGFGAVCGVQNFTLNSGGAGYTEMSLGGGLSRYTISGSAALHSETVAYENYAFQRNKATSYLDPVIDIDPMFLAMVGGSDMSVELSPGVSNASAPPPAVAGVPEPASWALLIAGFGMTGAVARRRRMAVVAS